MTDTETVTLTEFLLERIAEDQADDGLFAHTSACASHKFPDPKSWDPGDCNCGADDRHTAECEAKRQLVEDYEILAADYRTTRAPETEARRFQALIACARAAAVYADHPDYRDEWRP